MPTLTVATFEDFLKELTSFQIKGVRKTDGYSQEDQYFPVYTVVYTAVFGAGSVLKFMDSIESSKMVIDDVSKKEFEDQVAAKTKEMESKLSEFGAEINSGMWS